MIGKTTVKKDKNGSIVEIVHSDYLIDLSSFIDTNAIEKGLNESMELKEKVLKDFYITVRDNPEGTKYHFKKVDGTNLNKDFFAYKSDVRGAGWSVTDKASGISIKIKLATLKECKDYLANLSEEDQARIADLRQKPRYQKICNELAEFKLSDNQELNQDFPDPEE